MTTPDDCSRSDWPRWSDRDVERLIGALTGWDADGARDMRRRWEGVENERDDEAER